MSDIVFREIELIEGLNIKLIPDTIREELLISKIDPKYADYNNPGVVKYATSEDISNQINMEHVINPYQFKKEFIDKIASPATNIKPGFLKIASDQDIVDGISEIKVVTVKQLMDKVNSISYATTSKPGLIRIATLQDALNETITNKAITPSHIIFKEDKSKKGIAGGYVPLDVNRKVLNVNLYEAMRIRLGIVRIATDSEYNAGIIDNVAVNTKQFKQLTTKLNDMIATLNQNMTALSSNWSILMSQINSRFNTSISEATDSITSSLNNLRNRELQLIANVDAVRLSGQNGSYYRCSGCSWTCMGCTGGCNGA